MNIKTHTKKGKITTIELVRQFLMKERGLPDMTKFKNIEKTEHWIIDYEKSNLCVKCDLPYMKGQTICPHCGGRLKTKK